MTDQAAPVPLLSIVVIFHDMPREAPRTLHTLSPGYQRGVAPRDYEVIAIDNGSSRPVGAACIDGLADNVSYHFFETSSVSPVDAIAFGMGQARGRHVALIVDGARMVTPGIVAKTLRALGDFEVPFVCALGWHLGPDIQRVAMKDGYDQAEEDRLLRAADWRKDGYGLFDVSTLAPSSRPGFLGGMPAECSWLAMRKDTWDAMGGYDTRFRAPGGGLVNHDFLNRLWSVERLSPVVLLGEGSFHQMHGGIMTNSTAENLPIADFRKEYEQIRGHPFAVAPAPEPYYMGEMAENALKFLADRQRSAERPTSGR